MGSQEQEEEGRGGGARVRRARGPSTGRRACARGASAGRRACDACDLRDASTGRRAGVRVSPGDSDGRPTFGPRARCRRARACAYARASRRALRRSAGAPAGSSFYFGASDIHRVLHAGSEPAVTIHAYSPPLVRMGSYTIEANGQLRRHAVSHEDELRELSAAS